MGCICPCHAKLDAIGVRGCCFDCEKEHDPLRNALAKLERVRLLWKERKTIVERLDSIDHEMKTLPSEN